MKYLSMNLWWFTSMLFVKVKNKILYSFLLSLIWLRDKRVANSFLNDLIHIIVNLIGNNSYLFYKLTLQSQPFPIKNDTNIDAEVHTVLCHQDVLQFILALKTFLS